VDPVARAIAAAGVAVTPNLGVHASSLEQVRRWDAVLARAEMRFLNPRTRATWGWDPTGEGRRGNAQGEARWTRTTTFFRDALVPALHRAGVTILAGSDAPIPAIIPGSGFHEELRLLAEAGLAPVEVLRAATRNAARVNGVDDRRGRVRVGFDADLLLVASDPRLGVEALRHRVGVMVGGRWHAQEALDREVAALIATYRP
jgi:imidazolonepropionase-like amidohydrolase